MAEANIQVDVIEEEVDGNIQPIANANERRVNAVQIKLPPFWKADPELWFLQIEAQFSSNGIRADLSKYNQIVGKLDSDILSKVSDIVKNPPLTHKYDAIKNRLTKEFTESDKKKLRTLFNDLSLNEDRPSDLLHKMREKSCNKVGDELLQELWSNRLPQQIQAILSCSNVPLDTQVELTDKIFETLDTTSINAVSKKSDTDIDTRFCKLEEQIASLCQEVKRSISRNSSANRYRSPSRSNNKSNTLSDSTKNTFCFYHQKYKQKAKKCYPPCTFNDNTKN